MRLDYQNFAFAAKKTGRGFPRPVGLALGTSDGASYHGIRK
jgi:hypothetical protein